MASRKALVATESIETKILTIRGHRVMLDADLAELYGVETKRFNEQVRRNVERFPEDFMFQLSEEEFDGLRSQFATSNNSPGRARHDPVDVLFNLNAVCRGDSGGNGFECAARFT